MPRTTIVLPCYNEAKRLDAERLRRFASGRTLRLLLVDDGSTDQTRSILQRLADADPLHFELLGLDQNQGKAEAVRRGLLHAIEQGADYVGFWDGDLATPLEYIPHFAEVLDRRPDIHMVLGTRIPLLGRSIQRKPIRHVLGRLFATTASMVLSLRIYDTQCGAKLLRVSPQIAAAIGEPFCSRWIFDVEILARLRRINHRRTGVELKQMLYEFPLETWEDVAGSKVRPSDFLRALGELATIYWRYRRPGAPPIHVEPLRRSSSRVA